MLPLDKAALSNFSRYRNPNETLGKDGRGPPASSGNPQAIGSFCRAVDYRDLNDLVRKSVKYRKPFLI
jgi:hypothetical protein